jgi:hypothetical protein
MTADLSNMKYTLALKSIAARYAAGAMLHGYQTNWATAFLTFGKLASDGSAPD